jgi:L-ascorbate metabolism protein UlaG (beta-lactamase superfamily)
MDIGLIHALRESSIHWVVPSSILDKMIKAGVNTDLITVSQALVQIKFESISITPFDGLHFHKNKNGDLLGVPAMGYLVEQGRKRWLFPGDTRTYQPELMPSFGPVDAVFAHLWLGRASALENQAWQINEFCQFHLAFRPKRIIITHLRELGRDANDFWDIPHAKLIKSRFKVLSPETDISIALTGQQVDI